MLQLLACLTMWNAFYSLLWGFSGSLMYDVHNDARLRDRERLILSYGATGSSIAFWRDAFRTSPAAVGWPRAATTSSCGRKAG